MSPSRRRSLKDAARDPLAAKPQSAKFKERPSRNRAAGGVPVVLKITIGLLIGFTGGFLLGRFNRWI